MKEYTRENPLFSLCGLNCGLCPRYHTEGASRCPGCGGEDFLAKHPPCGVISCSQRRGGMEYCYLCGEYPCEKYEGNALFDSFITHQKMRTDFDRAKNEGLVAYGTELGEKVAILEDLLAHYNDGRRKGYFCLAVNLLALPDVKWVMARLGQETGLEEAAKEKAVTAVRLFEAMAAERGIVLKLNKKKA